MTELPPSPSPLNKRLRESGSIEERGSKHETLMRYSILAMAVVALIVAIRFYLNRVGIPDLGVEAEPTSEAAKVAAWGQFGDFMGGVLNPLYGFMTVMLLLVSIKQQREELQKSTDELRRSASTSKAQLEHLEVQAKKDELFRLIEMLSRRIDERLGQDVSFHKGHFENQDIRGIENVLGNTFSMREFLFRCNDLTVLNNHSNFDFDHSIRALRMLFEDLSEMTNILVSYGKLKEVDETIRYYWVRYAPLVRKLLMAKQLHRPIVLGEPHCTSKLIESFWYAANSKNAGQIAKQAELA